MIGAPGTTNMDVPSGGARAEQRSGSLLVTGRPSDSQLLESVAGLMGALHFVLQTIAMLYLIAWFARGLLSVLRRHARKLGGDDGRWPHSLGSSSLSSHDGSYDWSSDERVDAFERDTHDRHHHDHERDSDDCDTDAGDYGSCDSSDS